jgi:adenylyltransferase/sulfurtransferase
MQQGRIPVLVDVREPPEWEIGHLAGARLLPLGVLGRRMGELNRHDPIVTYCHHGVRSLHAAELLLAAGFTDVRSLRGGLDAWARTVDPAVPRY